MGFEVCYSSKMGLENILPVQIVARYRTKGHHESMVGYASGTVQPPVGR
jgi:hypothetical protein